MPARQAYYCGNWIPETELAIPVADLGFAMGVTVTERLRTFAGQVFRLAAHMERMHHSLAMIGLSADELTAEISAAIEEWLHRHAGQLADGDDWAVVAFVTPGSGLGPTTCVHGFPLPFAEWAGLIDQGLRTYVSEHRQVPPTCWPPELKCRSRMHYYLADSEARRRDPAARAILLDQEGFIGEGSTANVVIYHRDRGLATPRFEKVLAGVSVSVIEELATSLGVPFEHRDLLLQELLAAEEVWFTSTSICLLPVTHCNDQPIGTGDPGPMYRQLLAAWNDLVGVDILAQAQQYATRL